MKHIKLILGLTVCLIFLLGVKYQKDTTEYPLKIKQTRLYNRRLERDLDLDGIKKVSNAVKDREKNKCDDPLFFCRKGTTLGQSKEAFERLSNSDNSISIKGKKVPCNAQYLFNKNDLLGAVQVMITATDSTIIYYEQTLCKYYGNMRIDIRGKYNGREHIWYFPDYYVFLEYDEEYNEDDVLLITVRTYDHKEYTSKANLAIFGGCYKSDFSKKENKTYKYGDSDVYQGSSQQKADLKAIDDYFGF